MVQSYRPSYIGEGVTISVSGIDFSWDKHEILILYKSYQVVLIQKESELVSVISQNFASCVLPFPFE